VSRVLVTGFEPFEGRGKNRSWELVSRLPPAAWLTRRKLPVSFAAVAELVPLLLDEADVLVMTGEAAGDQLAAEAVALNIGHARVADNAGAQPRNEPLVPGGPLALPARWDASLAAGLLRGRLSFHAGTFVCNAALYHALHAASARPTPRVIGFVHVPIDPTPDDAAAIDALWQLLLTMR
jgi:pyroglutamyl-peptidase